ncbi:TetR/AcrR family transcriptional regulator [Agromyces protaetiae]|uniref:TetR/AcrR family transcriptional regulator n=1 Tax=Agromyces protaetiae TaxID=2509455 RepID=A0A4P6FC94_9MICO|nr:TetR family transcriptional regulator [Agromyces protaetiae]QAY73474.1 TetR/AcrR family transcriptional regulator [Agromyces protaetiae]
MSEEASAGHVGAPRRRGRPKGSTAGETRARILEAAQAEFAALGYEAASLRGVARRAGVDASLVHHYFDDKSGLVAAVMDVPARPDRLIAEAVDGPLDGMGERMVRMVLSAWDSPAVRPAGLAIVKSIVSGGPTGKVVLEFFRREMLAKVAARLPGDDAALRAELAVSQIIGLVVARYVARFEPLASAGVDDLAARIGPVVQAHLTGRYGPLDGAEARANNSTRDE